MRTCENVKEFFRNFRKALCIQQNLDTITRYDRYHKARQGLNIEEAMVIKISALRLAGFAKL